MVIPRTKIKRQLDASLRNVVALPRATLFIKCYFFLFSNTAVSLILVELVGKILNENWDRRKIELHYAVNPPQPFKVSEETETEIKRII